LVLASPLLSRLQWAWVTGWHILLPALFIAEEWGRVVDPTKMTKPYVAAG
jgi:hypothetical protein